MDLQKIVLTRYSLYNRNETDERCGNKVKRTVTCFGKDSRFACVAKLSTRELHYFADLHIRRHREFALSHTELYEGPITQENSPLTRSVHCNFHFHFCEERSMHRFPFNVPGAFQVFTSGALCSQAALVRCYFSHSLLEHGFLSLWHTRQLLSNGKPTPYLKLHACDITYDSVHHTQYCHSVHSTRRFGSWLYFRIQVSACYYAERMLPPTSSRRLPR